MKYTCSILLIAIFIMALMTSQTVYAGSISATTMTYLKDGIKENDQTTYKVDYHMLLDYSTNSSRLKMDGDIGDKSFATNNSKVIVTDSTVFRDIVLKKPSTDNPNSYDIDSIVDSFKIDSVEILDGGQLNKYTSEPTIVRDSVFSPILTETSLTTAELKIEMVAYDN